MLHDDGYCLTLACVVEGLAPPPRLAVWEWADKYRRLPSKGAAEPGPWRTDRVPFTREIMACLSPASPVQRVVYMKSTQVAGTEVGNNWVGSVIHHHRIPMMIVQPTIDLAERWSKQRLAAMIAETFALALKIAPSRSRDSGNTTLVKEWAGGVLIISGANSAASLRSMPAKYLFCDEVDAYPVDLDGEGDPLSLAEARTSTFQDRKIFLCSTPTIESLSVIAKEYEASDQRHYHVPCPHCGGYQPLVWEQLHWPEGDARQAVYLCTECGQDIEEHSKTRMLAAGRWKATFPEREVAGFHINSLYTPIGLGFSWGELAEMWEKVRRNPNKLKTFTNTKLGICVADPEERLDWEEMKHRAEAYACGTLPPGCLVLTAGVDVQGDRWAVLVLGHGRDEEQWIVDYHEIDGDPTKPADWARLEEYLTQTWTNVAGMPLRLSCVAVDSGYLQDDVINYTRFREARGILAIKGASQRGRQIIGRASRVDYTWRGATYKAGAKQWQVGEDVAKERIFRILQADRGQSEPQRRMHFPAGLDESFYSMLTAEVYDPNKRKWVKIRARNEVLDCLVYAIAASRHPRQRLDRRTKPWWDQLASALEPAVPDMFSAHGLPAAAKAAPKPPPAAPPAAASGRRRSAGGSKDWW